MRLRLLLPALVVIGGLTAAPVPPAALQQDWLLFRGNPLQTGVSPAKLPDKLAVLWTFSAKDSIEGAPAIVKDTVFVASTDENLYAVDLATGKEKWQYKGGPFKASPAWRDERVFIGDLNGLFHCVDARTGKKLWTYESGAEINSGANFAENAVLFGSFDETLYCLDPMGKLRWKVKTEGPVNGSPVVVGNRTFVAGCDSHVHSIDLTTGKETASVELGGQAAATAAVVGDHLYVGTMTNQVQAVDWKKAEVAWTFQPEKRSQPFYASAAVTESLVVAGSRDKKIYALERATGKEKWNFATDGRVDASPVVVGSRVYAGSLDGNLYVLDLDTGKGLQTVNLDSAVTGSPAVIDGKLLVGTEKGTLYCLGAK
jgi:outer membrane protein assembly factor BamB